LRQRAIQHFEWEKAGQYIVETYQQLVGQTNPNAKLVKRTWATTQK